MLNFKPLKFFNLTFFRYKDIFNPKLPVWQALTTLEIYFKEWFSKRGGRKEIFIDEGTTIESGTMIKGPAIIGRNCQIRHGAYLRENVIIGDNCVIGHATEIKHSILLNKVSVAHFNYVGNSILGNNVGLGGGTILANFRLDGKEIQIDYDGKKTATGLIKLGSILADNVSIGCQTVCNPGTILEKNCLVYPLTAVKGYYKEESIIK